MLLWSIQHKRAYEKMEQTGVLRADKNFIATDWFENSFCDGRANEKAYR